MAFIRKIRVGGHVYYAKVENHREGGTTKQRIIEYLGRFPAGEHHPLPLAHARQVLSDILAKTLSQQSIRDLLDSVGIHIGEHTVRIIGIEFDVRRKRCTLRLR